MVAGRGDLGQLLEQVARTQTEQRLGRTQSRGWELGCGARQSGFKSLLGHFLLGGPEATC